MIRIWIISKYASGPKFGYATRHYYLGKYLAMRNDLNVTIVGSRSLGFTSSPAKFKGTFIQYESENLEFVVLNGPKIKSGFSLLRLWSWFLFEYRLFKWSLKTKDSPQVIIVSSLSLLTFITGVFFKWRYKSKLILEVRDIWPLTLQHIKNLSKYNPFLLFLSYVEKFGYRNADVIIGTMPNLSEHVYKVLPNCKKKVEYVPMGFDHDFFNTQLNSDGIDFFFALVKKKFKFIVGYTGSIGLANAVDELIMAANLLKNNDIAFAILGDGPEKKKLLQRCEDLQIENVFFYDKIDREYVQQFLSYCDILINPIPSNNPVYRYGVSPNKWIDYLYSGKPILIPFDGFQCIVNEANCGEFIKASNPDILVRIILKYREMSQNELFEIGKRGKEFLFENLSYKSLSDRYYDIFTNK